MPSRMPSGTAIFDLKATITKRHNPKTGKRQSAVAGAAYRSGTSLHDKLTGKQHDYVNKCAVFPDAIIAPENAEAWVYDRGELWNRHEAKEKRKDAQIYREVRVALPKAFKPDQNRAMTLEWAKAEFVSLGMVAHIGFHDLEGVNPHAHIALTMRDLLPDGFGNKNRSWNKFMPVMNIPKSSRNVEFTTLVDEWRAKWSAHVNHYLDKFGFEERISHLSNADREGVSDLENVNLSKSAFYFTRNNPNSEAAKYREAAKSRNKIRMQKANSDSQLKEIFGVNSHEEFLQKLNADDNNFYKSNMIDYD